MKYQELLVAITNAGTGYKPGAYTSVPLTGGNGTGAEADITISGDTVITVSISNAGSGYTEVYTVTLLFLTFQHKRLLLPQMVQPTF